MSNEEWAAHVKAWRQGEMSAKAYCEAHGLKLSTLRYKASRIKDGGRPRVRMARVTTTPSAGAGRIRLVSAEIPPDASGDALQRVLELFEAKR